MTLLATMQQQYERTGRAGASCDIDDTLAHTTLLFFERTAEKFGAPHMGGARALMEEYTYTWHVPEWDHPQAREFINRLRYSQETTGRLEAIAEAQEYVPRVHEIKQIRLYATARPSEMNRSTKRWILAKGFPDARILAIPRDVDIRDAHEWKAEELMKFYPFIDVHIDDRALIAETLKKMGYKGIIYLLGHESHPDAEGTIIPKLSWRGIYKDIISKELLSWREIYKDIIRKS